MKKPSYFNQCIKLLQEIHKDYPSHDLSSHIATALADYRDIWGIPDKEFLFALEKYKSELEFNTVPEKELDRIIKDGENLDTLFKDEEEDDFL